MSCAMFQTGLWGFSLGGCLVLVTPSCPKTSQTKIANKRHYQYFLSLYFICYCLISAFISLLPCFSLFLSLSLCSLNTAVGDVFTQASTPPHTHTSLRHHKWPSSSSPPLPGFSEAWARGVEEKCTLSFYINTSSLTDKGRGHLPSFPNCKSSSSVLQGAEPTVVEA